MKKLKHHIEPFLLTDEQKEIFVDILSVITLVCICTFGLFGGLILLNTFVK